jgi:polar amino acid transport system substrate-binding protein
MKKRIAAVATAALLLVTSLVLAGCGGEKTDWEYVKDNGELVIGLDDTFAPMGFRDKNDKLVGFDIDLARAVCKEMGVKATFKSIDWDAKESELNSKKIDCIWNGMSATEERQKNMSLSNKYLNNKIIIMSLKKDVNVKSVNDLKDRKIGTQAGSAALEAMEGSKDYSSFKDNVKTYKSYDNAILDMKAGRLDCIVIDEVLGEYKNNNMKETLYVSDYNFGDDFYAVGFRKDDKELTKKANEALKATIDDGTAAKISKKWFGKDIVVFEGYN